MKKMTLKDGKVSVSTVRRQGAPESCGVNSGFIKSFDQGQASIPSTSVPKM
ncbi:MAG: hypothetical protein OXC62_03070 [Aestuariivita sp.]|nr:hypothetical protein [Aestuariivita sp.]